MYGSNRDFFGLLQRLSAPATRDPWRPNPVDLGTAEGLTEWLRSPPPAWINDYAGLATGATDPEDLYYRELVSRANLVRRRYPHLPDLGVPQHPSAEDLATRRVGRAERMQTLPPWLRQVLGLPE